MKTKFRKARNRPIPTPPGPEEGDEALVAYLQKYDLEELEKAGYATEPSPEEIRDLDECVQRDMRRQKTKGLAGEYPKCSRPLADQLATALKALRFFKTRERADVGHSLNVIADKSHDVEEIVDRILHEKHTPEEVAELLFALDKMLEYLWSYWDGLGTKLIQAFDHVKGLETGKDGRRPKRLALRMNRKKIYP